MPLPDDYDAACVGRAAIPRQLRTLRSCGLACQDNTGGLYKKHAQVFVVAFRKPTMLNLATCRSLPWHKPEPGREVVSLLEGTRIADGSNNGTGDDQPDAMACHEAVTDFVLFGQQLHLLRY